MALVQQQPAVALVFDELSAGFYDEQRFRLRVRIEERRALDPRGDDRPERAVGLRQNQLAQAARPEPRRAVLAPPRLNTPREALALVFPRIPDRAMHLLGDPGDRAGCVVGARLRDRGGEGLALGGREGEIRLP